MENEISIELIYNNMSDKLKKYIVASVKDVDLADDIFQEIFLKIFINLSSLKDTAKLNSWVFQIVRNTIIDFIRLKKIEPLPLADDFIPAKSKDYHYNLNTDITHNAFKSLIETFPTNYAEVLIMNIFDEMPSRQIANKLGISESAAKSRLKRARKHLRKKLNEYCIFELDRRGMIIDCQINEKAKSYLKKRKII